MLPHERASSYRVQSGLPGALGSSELKALQLQRLNETLAWAREHSRYYRSRVLQTTLNSVDELRYLPLTDSTVFERPMGELLCLPQNQISRIVSLYTSGTTGEPKRIAFTASEQETIVSYLASGMRMLAQPGETVAVLYPCERAGSLGQLIAEALNEAQRGCLAYGLPRSETGFSHLVQACTEKQVVALVGFPQHVFALSRWCEHRGVRLPIKKALLSADHVASSLKREIARIWNAQVFAHYGTTEMGYGGAVECQFGSGQHIRETDLFFEIIDPGSEEPVPEGQWGEVVFTTLNRKAMPLIRYRTGDRSRLIPGDCACGSLLRRLDTVQGRVDPLIPFTLYDLEEVVFSLPGVLDFSAVWEPDARTLSLVIQQLPDALDFNEQYLIERIEECFRSPRNESVSAREPEVPQVSITRTEADEYAPLYEGKRSVLRPS